MVTYGKQVVSVLVDKEKSPPVCIMSHYHAKLVKAKVKRKAMPLFVIVIAVYTRERVFQ